MFVNIQATFLVGKWHLSHLCGYATYHADIIIIIITAIEFSLGGSNPYTSTDKTNKKKYTKMKQYKDTVQITTPYIQLHILPRHPHNPEQVKQQIKQSQYSQVPSA